MSANINNTNQRNSSNNNGKNLPRPLSLTDLNQAFNDDDDYDDDNLQQQDRGVVNINNNNQTATVRPSQYQVPHPLHNNSNYNPGAAFTTYNPTAAVAQYYHQQISQQQQQQQQQPAPSVLPTSTNSNSNSITASYPLPLPSASSNNNNNHALSVAPTTPPFVLPSRGSLTTAGNASLTSIPGGFTTSNPQQQQSNISSTTNNHRPSQLSSAQLASPMHYRFNNENANSNTNSMTAIPVMAQTPDSVTAAASHYQNPLQQRSQQPIGTSVTAAASNTSVTNNNTTTASSIINSTIAGGVPFDDSAWPASVYQEIEDTRRRHHHQNGTNPISTISGSQNNVDTHHDDESRNNKKSENDNGEAEPTSVTDNQNNGVFNDDFAGALAAVAVSAEPKLKQLPPPYIVPFRGQREVRLDVQTMKVRLMQRGFVSGDTVGGMGVREGASSALSMASSNSAYGSNLKNTNYNSRLGTGAGGGVGASNNIDAKQNQPPRPSSTLSAGTLAARSKFRLCVWKYNPRDEVYYPHISSTSNQQNQEGPNSATLFGSNNMNNNNNIGNNNHNNNNGSNVFTNDTSNSASPDRANSRSGLDDSNNGSVNEHPSFIDSSTSQNQNQSGVFLPRSAAAASRPRTTTTNTTNNNNNNNNLRQDTPPLAPRPPSSAFSPNYYLVNIAGNNRHQFSSNNNNNNFSTLGGLPITNSIPHPLHNNSVTIPPQYYSQNQQYQNYQNVLFNNNNNNNSSPPPHYYSHHNNGEQLPPRSPSISGNGNPIQSNTYYYMNNSQQQQRPPSSASSTFMAHHQNMYYQNQNNNNSNNTQNQYNQQQQAAAVSRWVPSPSGSRMGFYPTKPPVQPNNNIGNTISNQATTSQAVALATPTTTKEIPFMKLDRDVLHMSLSFLATGDLAICSQVCAAWFLLADPWLFLEHYGWVPLGPLSRAKRVALRICQADEDVLPDLFRTLSLSCEHLQLEFVGGVPSGVHREDLPFMPALKSIELLRPNFYDLPSITNGVCVPLCTRNDGGGGVDENERNNTHHLNNSATTAHQNLQLQPPHLHCLTINRAIVSPNQSASFIAQLLVLRASRLVIRRTITLLPKALRLVCGSSRIFSQVVLDRCVMLPTTEQVKINKKKSTTTTNRNRNRGGEDDDEGQEEEEQEVQLLVSGIIDNNNASAVNDNSCTHLQNSHCDLPCCNFFVDSDLRPIRTPVMQMSTRRLYRMMISRGTLSMTTSDDDGSSFLGGGGGGARNNIQSADSTNNNNNFMYPSPPSSAGFPQQPTNQYGSLMNASTSSSSIGTNASYLHKNNNNNLIVLPSGLCLQCLIWETSCPRHSS